MFLSDEMFKNCPKVMWKKPFLPSTDFWAELLFCLALENVGLTQKSNELEASLTIECCVHTSCVCNLIFYNANMFQCTRPKVSTSRRSEWRYVCAWATSASSAAMSLRKRRSLPALLGTKMADHRETLSKLAQLLEVTLRSQVVFRSRLLGLRSLCSTLAEWMYLRPLRIW